MKICFMFPTWNLCVLASLCNGQNSTRLTLLFGSISIQKTPILHLPVKIFEAVHNVVVSLHNVGHLSGVYLKEEGDGYNKF